MQREAVRCGGRGGGRGGRSANAGPDQPLFHSNRRVLRISSGSCTGRFSQQRGTSSRSVGRRVASSGKTGNGVSVDPANRAGPVGYSRGCRWHSDIGGAALAVRTRPNRGTTV